MSSQNQFSLPVRLYRFSRRNLRKALAKCAKLLLPIPRFICHRLNHLCASEYQPIYPNFNGCDARKRDIFNQRWEAILGELSEFKEGSALDIGCNIGFFSFKLNELGYYVEGIDADPSNVFFCNSLIEHLGLENISFQKGSFDEARASHMPSFDVVLCLSVFHHVIRANGDEKSRQILRDLIAKTRRVIFMDIGQSPKAIEAFGLPPQLADDPISWMMQLLTDCGCQRVNVIGNFDTSVEVDEKRYLFAGWKTITSESAD